MLLIFVCRYKLYPHGYVHTLPEKSCLTYRDLYREHSRLNFKSFSSDTIRGKSLHNTLLVCMIETARERLFIPIFFWWNCRIRSLFFTSYGLAWGTMNRSVSILQHIVRHCFLARIRMTTLLQQEPAVTGVQTQVLMVESPALSHWAIPLSHYPETALAEVNPQFKEHS